MNGLITFASPVFVSSSPPLLPVILELAHDVGHEGTQKTLARLRTDFHIARDRATVQEFVRACLVFANGTKLSS